MDALFAARDALKSLPMWQSEMAKIEELISANIPF